MPDKYRSFSDLADSERKDIDYRIRVTARSSPVAIVAPHGGEIEPGTSQITMAIADADFSAYRFEGIEPSRPHGDLHIKSERFDEPGGCKLVASSEVVVGIHGRKDGEDQGTVWVGGRHESLRDDIVAALIGAGFQAWADTESGIAGMSPRNICNRGKGGTGGAQLEVPRTLRNELIKDTDKLIAFGNAVREAIRVHMS